jgi:hypothetical protein
VDIKVIEAPPAPLKTISPEELCEGRQTVTVVLEHPITLEIENCVVTYSRGEHQAPCVVANILWEHGAELVGADGLFMKRAAPKPKPMRYCDPFGGSMRWEL